MLLQVEKKLSEDTKPSDLELAIFRTAAYFAYSHYPVTAFELWKWLLEPAKAYSFAEVLEAIEGAFLKERLIRSGGFYTTEKDADILENRRNRVADALRKYAKLKRVTAILGRVPYVEGIAVCNSLAFHHTLPSSDIDLFVISKPGKIWSSRLFATLPLILLRERPGERAKDPVCLSFFASSNALAFEKLKIAERDPYLAYWSRSLIPLFDKTGWVKQFEAKNTWVKDVLPNAYSVKRSSAFKVAPRFALPVTPLSEVLAERIQEERFPQNIKALRNRDTRVVITKDMLKFHADDNRNEMREALDERMKGTL
jgi:hypothetical protein